MSLKLAFIIAKLSFYWNTFNLSKDHLCNDSMWSECQTRLSFAEKLFGDSTSSTFSTFGPTFINLRTKIIKMNEWSIIIHLYLYFQINELLFSQIRNLPQCIQIFSGSDYNKFVWESINQLWSYNYELQAFSIFNCCFQMQLFRKIIVRLFLAF